MADAADLVRLAGDQISTSPQFELRADTFREQGRKVLESRLAPGANAEVQVAQLDSPPGLLEPPPAGWNGEGAIGATNDRWALIPNGFTPDDFPANNLPANDFSRPGQFSSPSQPDAGFDQARFPEGALGSAGVPPGSFPPGSQSLGSPPAAVGRQIQIRPRGRTPISSRSIRRGNERVIAINVPTQINTVGQDGQLLAIKADQIVIWTDANTLGLGDLGANNANVEFYLEGNIVFQQGQQIIRAERMYYDLQRQTGVVLEAEVLADIPGYQGKFRVKTDVLRMLSSSVLQADDASFTTSRLGYPQYWVQSDVLQLDTGPTRLLDQLTQQRPANPDGTGAQLSDFEQLRVTSERTAVYLGGWPIFYWPRFSTDLARNPSLYLDGFQLGNDNVFGAQVLTRWDLFQLLGLPAPATAKWTASVDYLSKRGLGGGSDFDYTLDELFGSPASGQGFLHGWVINDGGLDNLGQDRRAVPLEEEFRGRLYGQHRHITPGGDQWIAELGWISDRNFLEQYYEQEWDLEKDQATRLEWKRYRGSGAWSVGGDIRLNPFLTQTEWLPRADHFQVGRSVFSRLTWYEHSSIGYGRLQVAEAPTNPVDAKKFDPLAWETPVEGLRAATRQELDLPFQLGPVRVVPYVLGEVAHWQEDLNASEVTRMWGQGGVRTSLPFSRIDRSVQNELFNLNGLAHKFVVDAEFFMADSNQDIERFPLYDALDDDAVEFFRRRLFFDTFQGLAGGNVPLQFDERNFAFRQGIQRTVNSPTTEIADDLAMLRLGLRNRWQTKRGLSGQERIVDWFTMDMEGSYFPQADRDNFGEAIGPATYDIVWHPGDRLTFLSNGYFDFFADGLRTVSLGAALNRPGKSNYYVGVHSIEGPISSNVLTSSASYQISPKFILNYGSSVDFSSTGNIGQSGSIVRVGESFLVSLGFHFDASRDNFGIRFGIAPRFIPSRLGQIAGYPIRPLGFYGLE